MSNTDQTVVVGMSGGVDSSVAAALLKEQGYQVQGVMLKLWNEPGREDENRCCAPDAMARARRVAAQIGIPFYVLDVKDLFRSKVVQYFIDQYGIGHTPNPCLVCNREIRWGFLRERAMEMGARYFASGHYARLQVLPDGRLQLLKSRDVNKDQSYVLAGLNQNQLATTLLPLGEFSKPEVRELARKFGLNVAEQPDSQDLCFIGDGDYRGFLARNSSHPSIPGEITNRRGELLGKHAGLSGYTIGQRKGLGIAAGTPLFVLEKDISKNRLVVGEEYELGRKCLIVEKINWISGTEPSSRFRGMVKIRYRAQEQPAMVEFLGKSQVRIEFENKLRDITPGQAAVIYNGDICLGGGIIAEAE